MTANVFHLKPRNPKVHHSQKAANRLKAEIIKDIAAIMGDDLDYHQLAKDLDLPDCYGLPLRKRRVKQWQPISHTYALMKTAITPGSMRT